MSLTDRLTHTRRQLMGRTCLLVGFCLCGILWVTSHGETEKTVADGAEEFRIGGVEVTSQIKVEFDAAEPAFYYPQYRRVSPMGSNWVMATEFQQFFNEGHHVVFLSLPDVDETKGTWVHMVKTDQEVRPTIFPQGLTQCPQQATPC